jgi:hypothetical protein
LLTEESRNKVDYTNATEQNKYPKRFSYPE